MAVNGNAVNLEAADDGQSINQAQELREERDVMSTIRIVEPWEDSKKRVLEVDGDPLASRVHFRILQPCGREAHPWIYYLNCAWESGVMVCPPSLTDLALAEIPKSHPPHEDCGDEGADWRRDQAAAAVRHAGVFHGLHLDRAPQQHR